MDHYAMLDSRIRIFHKPNGGISETRNFGINLIKGGYVTFIDSDDWVSTKYVEHLYHMLQTHSGDISVSAYLKQWNTSVPDSECGSKNTVTMFNRMDAIADMWYQKHIGVQPWGKLYRTDLFKNIHYPVGRIYEDLAVTHLLLWQADKIVYSPEPLYYYYQRNDSIMYRQFDTRNMDRIHASSELLGWAQENCPRLIPAAQTRFFVSNIQVLREIPLQGSYAGELQMIKHNLRKYRRIVLKNKEARVGIRFIALLSLANIRFLKKLGYFYKLIYK